MKSKFNVGDRVYSIRGNGMVFDIEKSSHPISVVYESGIKEWYREDTEIIKHNPKKDFPRLMEVSVDNESWLPRLVLFIKEKRPYFLEWVTDLNKIKHGDKILSCEYCREIQEPKFIELTFQDISDGKGVGVDPKLIKIKAS